MIAMRTPKAPGEVCGVNVILLGDGRGIHLDDIETAEAGQAILDDVDTSIDRIEIQILNADGGLGPNDPDWRRRAGIALKRKRRQRPRLQQRIGDLRRAARQVPPGGPKPPSTRRDDRRHAFVQAAEAMLGHEVFVEIWARAREMHPAAFGEQGHEVRS